MISGGWGNASGTAQLSFGQFLTMLDHLNNHRREIKAAVEALFSHAIHIEIGVARRPEMDRSGHQNRVRRILVVCHLHDDVRNIGEALGDQTGFELELPVPFDSLNVILFVCHRILAVKGAPPDEGAPSHINV